MDHYNSNQNFYFNRELKSLSFGDIVKIAMIMGLGGKSNNVVIIFLMFQMHSTMFRIKDTLILWQLHLIQQFI